MKVFMNMNLTTAHAAAMEAMFEPGLTSAEMSECVWQDRPKAHIPIPPDESGDEIVLKNFRFGTLQRQWAKERGLPQDVSLEDIALSQIEESRAEIFYNHNWALMSEGFVRHLPGCVRKTVVWHGAPAPNDHFTQYDLVLSNFPYLNAKHEAEGAKEVRYFSPSHDPYAESLISQEKDIDILFIGTYSRHHRKRARLLEAIARMGDKYNLHLHLQNSRFTKLAETPLGWIGPFRQVRRSAPIRKVAKAPVFGSALYRLIGRSKIVVNMAIDYAGPDRGNMRCFESLTCGAALVSDHGDYPDGFVDGETFAGYGSVDHALEQIEMLLNEPAKCAKLAARGHQMIRTKYPKHQQWSQFCSLL